MEPEQPQTGHNPYDFIMNPEQPVRHPLGGGLPVLTGGSFGKKLMVLLGGAVVFMGLITVIVLLFFNNSGVTPQLIDLAATQNEIVHVATLGGGLVTQPSTQKLAIDVQLTAQTQQHQLINYLAGLGTKVSSSQLTSRQNLQTDAELNAAQNNSTVDSVFSQVVQQQLQAYAATMKQVFTLTSNPNTQRLLAADYKQTQLLLIQVPSASSLQD